MGRGDRRSWLFQSFEFFRRVDVGEGGLVGEGYFNHLQGGIPGVDLASAALEEGGEKDLVGAHVGRLAPEKNLPLVLSTFEAIRRYSPSARLLLVGDAGAMVDPFTGHGIHTALDAGRLAGEVLAGCLARGDLGAQALAELDQRWHQRWGVEVALGRTLQRLSAAPWRVESGLRYVCGRERLRRLTGGLVGHALARRALLPPGALWRARRERDVP